MDRRNFLHSVARGGLLAILVALSGVLLNRKQISLLEDCPDNFQCRSCNKINRCRLPEASTVREDG